MMAEKIRMLLAKKDMKLTQLAELLGTSQPNLWKKMKRDNFSEKELLEIAEVLGIKYEANFILEDETKI
ncbi:helix-turn-helix domain-containing protein [Lysinibacillus sp. NPDC096212]|uniref:helix-turn-helix domain-containing protein n=1 Tax=Lysinibacillus sp. NPDC096212 TaxID=3364135 RepID=UPI00380BD901